MNECKQSLIKIAIDGDVNKIIKIKHAQFTNLKAPINGLSDVHLFALAISKKNGAAIKKSIPVMLKFEGSNIRVISNGSSQTTLATYTFNDVVL